MNPEYLKPLKDKKAAFENPAGGDGYKLSLDWEGTKLIHVRLIFPDGRAGVFSYWLNADRSLTLQSTIKIEKVIKKASSFEVKVSRSFLGTKGDEFYCTHVGEKGQKLSPFVCEENSKTGNLISVPITTYYDYLKYTDPKDLISFVVPAAEIGF